MLQSTCHGLAQIDYKIHRQHRKILCSDVNRLNLEIGENKVLILFFELIVVTVLQLKNKAVSSEQIENDLTFS